jgi:hypothetical protein
MFVTSSLDDIANRAQTAGRLGTIEPVGLQAHRPEESGTRRWDIP